MDHPSCTQPPENLILWLKERSSFSSHWSLVRKTDTGRHGSWSPGLKLSEEACLGRAEEQPVAIGLAQEVEMVADQCEAVDIAMGNDLERAVTLPEAPAGAEGLDHAADQGGKVEVRGRLLAQGVKSPDLDTDASVLSQGAEGVDVGVADHPVAADAPEMVDDAGGLGEPAAHPFDFGEAVGVDQATQSLSRPGCRGEHRLIAGRLEPARRRLLAVPGLD